jgi:hypothetical protein
VNYACLSCGAKYSIPDTRVQKAGREGLRIRCSRCRAIMAVSTSMLSDHRADDAFGPPAAAPTTTLITGVMMNPFASAALPSQFAASGDVVVGADRNVTGVFLRAEDADLGLRTKPQRPTQLRPSDRFYAAINGEARGPFSAQEMLMLAEKGKVRAGTLLWRPQSSGWTPLKNVTEYDVEFLRAAVRDRKRREREAELLAQRKLGITPVRLERTTMRTENGARPFGRLFDDLDAGNITSPPTLQQLAEPTAWQVPGAPSTSTPSPSAPTRTAFWVALAVVVVLVGGALATGFIRV